MKTKQNQTKRQKKKGEKIKKKRYTNVRKISFFFASWAKIRIIKKCNITQAKEISCLTMIEEKEILRRAN